MSILKTIVAIFLSTFMIISNEITAIIPVKIPDARSETELVGIDEKFDIPPLAQEIIVVSLNGVSNEERTAIVSLQGLVNRAEAKIFINYGGESLTELKDLEAMGCTLSYSDGNGNPWRLSNLVEKFGSHISDNGYVLFTDPHVTEQLNMAFNYTTVFGWLAVPVGARSIVDEIGMVKKEDLTDDDIDFTFERDFYEKHKDKFTKKALVNLIEVGTGVRDFAVQQRIFITYVGDEDHIALTFRDQLLKDLEPASMVLGWGQFEIKYVEKVSSYGHYVVPSDYSFNMSILCSNTMDTGKLGQSVEAPDLDPGKHYVAIVYSDGDNAQWISNGYKEFYTWQSYDISTPITWTFSPQMNIFSPTAIKKAIDNKGEDSFVTGPSGAGYARINKMSGKELEVYSDLTAATMLRHGMTTLTLLNQVPGNLYEDMVFSHKLGYFSRYDNIKGGILQLDGDRYASGKGKVYFSNDKPFVSVKLSLWHPGNDANQVTEEWLGEQAEIVNNYPADINSINGYSVINVHPWTVGPDDLAYFVSQLDEGVEVISADELIAAVAQNVPHKDAKPE